MTTRSVLAIMTTRSTGRQEGDSLQAGKISLRNAKANVKSDDAFFLGETSMKATEADYIPRGQSDGGEFCLRGQSDGGTLFLRGQSDGSQMSQLSEDNPFKDNPPRTDEVDILRMKSSNYSSNKSASSNSIKSCPHERSEICGVVASTDIPAHVTAGPYPGGLDFGARTSDRQHVHNLMKVAWQDGRLVSDGDDGSNQGYPFLANNPKSKLQRARESKSRMKWMMLLQPARDRLEQNVEVVSEGGCLLLHVLQPIRQGEPLLLWYSESLARAFGIPILTPAHIRGDQQYTCTNCHTTFQYPNTLKAHILFKCDVTTSISASPLSSRLTSSSEVTIATSPSQFGLHFGLRPSASGTSEVFLRPRSPCSLTVSSVRTHGLAYALSSATKRNWNDGMLKTDITHKITSQPDRRAMTPDSSTDGKKPLRSSGSSLSSPSTHFAVLHSERIAAARDPDVLSSFGPTGRTDPLEILNHIHSPAQPALPLLPNQHMALKLYYPWLAALPAADSSSNKILCASIPEQSFVLDHHNHLGFHPGHHHILHHQSGNLMFSQRLSLDPDSQSLLMMSSSKPSKMNSDHGMSVPIVSQPLSTSDNTLTYRNNRSPSNNHPDSSPVSRLPFLPVPSEKKGEPLDLFPPSFFSHKSRKGHLCIYCGKLYSRKYGLKIHLRTHTGYKPLKCKVCFRPFGDPSNLNKHVRLHAEGETPYRCDYCGKVLVRRRDLERHIRSRHPLEAKEDNEMSTECVESEIDVTSDTESSEDSGEQEIEVT